MADVSGFQNIPTTILADVLGREQVMKIDVRPLWSSMPRVAGPAFTVRCPPGDNLMLHAAVHHAPAGSILVVDAGGDVDYALAGGNVCAVARRRGIAALVTDGVIRDLAEVRELGFPVFAKGVIPIPGTKTVVGRFNDRVHCAGVEVNGGDIVVADEEGVVVTPEPRREQVLLAAEAKLAKEADETLDEWQAAHRARIDRILADNGFED